MKKYEPKNVKTALKKNNQTMRRSNKFKSIKVTQDNLS